MQLHPSGHTDTFPRESLPPFEDWPTLEFTLPELQYPERLNVAARILDEGVERYGADRPALRTPDGEVWSYGELQRHANQVAHVLTEDYGLVPGNRVLLRGANAPWLVASWFGIVKAGCVVITTMAAFREHELTTVSEIAKPQLLITSAAAADEAIASGELTGVPVVAYGEGAGLPDLIELAAGKPHEFEAADTASDDVVLLGPTSGTTGVPKLTMHFHRDVLANFDTFGRHILQLREDDIVSGSPPLGFTFGLGGLVIFPLLAGASTLLVERATPPQLADLVAEHGVTVLFTAPTAYRAMLREGKAEALRGLRVGVSAGENLTADTFEQVREATGLRLLNGIGATEMLHIFLSATVEEGRPGTTGRPIPGFRTAILDDEGNELPDGERGRLAVIGPVGCRYMNDERQKNYVDHGWNVTGDTYWRDEDGYYHYEARSDSMLQSSGYNIGAPEVEAAVDAHPDVLECAVIGRPDPDRGQLVTAYIVLRDGVEGSDELVRDIQAFVRSRIAPFKYPRLVGFVDALPRNPSGKLQHFKLRNTRHEDLVAWRGTTEPVGAAGAAPTTEGN